MYHLIYFKDLYVNQIFKWLANHLCISINLPKKLINYQWVMILEMTK